MLKKLLKKDQVIILKNKTKKTVFKEMIKKINKEKVLLTDETILKKLEYRENVMSTGIGIGLGIPHFRDINIKEPNLIIGIQKEGISDYESIDNSLVVIVIMILMGENQHKSHIRLLSEIVPLFKDKKTFDRILNEKSSEKIISILLEKIKEK